MLRVSGAHLEQETGNLRWTGQATVVNFLKHTNIDMQLQQSCTGPEGGQGDKSEERHIQGVSCRLAFYLIVQTLCIPHKESGVNSH